jgi:hypothetical protein
MYPAYGRRPRPRAPRRPLLTPRPVDALPGALALLLTEEYAAGAPPRRRALDLLFASGAVLHDLRGPDLLVADGYADLDPGGRPGLGGHAHAESGIPVIEVAKPRFRTATHGVRSCADPRDARCSSPRPGCPAPTQPPWSGAWPAGTGCPAHCVAPIPSHGRARPQPA